MAGEEDDGRSRYRHKKYPVSMVSMVLDIKEDKCIFFRHHYMDILVILVQWVT